MATPRFAAGTSLNRCPSTRISPFEMLSSPAIIRSSVDLPQPDGPTNTISSPERTSRLMSRSTSTVPKVLAMPDSVRSTIAYSPFIRVRQRAIICPASPV